MMPAGDAPGERMHVRVEGLVQGVGFRWFVREHATLLGVAGWVRNLADGAVEVLAVGPESAVAALRHELEQGPPGARVHRVEELAGGAAPSSPAFEIRR